MSAETIIPKQTAAVTTAKIVRILDHKEIPATIFARDLAGGETVTIEISEDDGVSGGSVLQDGSTVELNATSNNTFSVNSPMTLRITKSITVSAVGVFIERGRSEAS